LPGSWLAPAFGHFFARSGASLKDNYFLRTYVCTSCADSKRSVSDRWLINDKEAQSALNISIFHYLNLFIFTSARSVTLGSIVPFFNI